MRTARNLLVALLAVVLPALALALDAPHDKSFLPGNCQECHQLHNALGGSLTTQATMSDGCNTCHNTHPNARLGFPWATGDQAVRGVSGVHHRWNADAVQAAADGFVSALPTDPEMAKRIIAGKMECTVCHNQHAANKLFVPTASLHSSIAVGGTAKATRTFPLGLPVGTADLTMVSIDTAAAVARGYNLRVISAGNVALSHDSGLTWFRPVDASGTSWVADPTPTGGPYNTATDLTLDDTAVKVRLGAGAAVNDTWDFYVSFPMVRSPNLTGSVCLSCHTDRAQGHGDVEAGGNGVKLFSHPVGEILNANGRNYDRAIPLDADGGVQGPGTGDTNATNDMLLGAGNAVNCTSCHAPHNTDSNSLTVDPR